VSSKTARKVATISLLEFCVLKSEVNFTDFPLKRFLNIKITLEPTETIFVPTMPENDSIGGGMRLKLFLNIEEKGKLDVPGRPRLFATTAEFLRCFGISSVMDLPEITKEDEYQKESAHVAELI